jgi:hypothetical protein
LALGQVANIGLVDASGNPVPATYSLSGTKISNPGSIDPKALFPTYVAMRFNYAPNGRVSLQIVHKGTVTLTIRPDPATQLQPVSLNIVAVDPSGLGSSHPEVDKLVYPIADALGIPPQFIKAQMAQESGAKFNPKALRYEPLAPYVGDYGGKPLGSNGDPGGISRNDELRVNNATISAYRYAAKPDALAPKGLPQGALVTNEDLALAIPYLPSCGCPNPTALDIVKAFDKTQHWSTQGKTAAANYKKLLAGDDFTAQISLASSYGYLQVTYATAITKLKWQGASGRQNPSLLFDTPENLAIGGGSLNLGAKYLALSFAQSNPAQALNPVFSDPDALIKAFYRPWKRYNGSSKYPPKVAARIPTYLPVLDTQISGTPPPIP